MQYTACVCRLTHMQCMQLGGHTKQWRYMGNVCMLKAHYDATQEYTTLSWCSQSPVEELRSEVLLELLIDQSLDAVVAAVFL